MPLEDLELEALITDDDPISTPDLPLAMSRPKWLTPRQAWHKRFIPSFPSTVPRFKSEWMKGRVAALVRPRFTVRYLLVSMVVAYWVYCVITNQHLFASKLPGYTGPYGVGIVDVETPVEKRVVYPAKLTSGEEAFEMQSLLVSVYYPIEKEYKSRKERYYWFSKPIGVTAEGYARFAGVSNFITRPVFTFLLWAVAGGIRIPAEVDAPLYGKEIPVMVFSHGMASSRTDYTAFLGELASRGYIIAAIEHRDGSCPGSTIHLSPNDKGKKVRVLKKGDLKDKMDIEEFKRAQLAFRDAEIVAAVEMLKGVHEGGKILNTRTAATTLEFWKGRLDIDRLTIGGHSYGATGALQALSTVALNASAGLILDPGKSSGPLNNNTKQPLLIIHSNSWSKPSSILFHGRPHFATVRSIAFSSPAPSWFLTSLGTSHPSVTDAPLLEPLLLAWTTGSEMNVREALGEYVKVSGEFLDFVSSGKVGKTGGVLEVGVTHWDYGAWVSEKRQGEVDKDVARKWEIHVSPQV